MRVSVCVRVAGPRFHGDGRAVFRGGARGGCRERHGSLGGGGARVSGRAPGAAVRGRGQGPGSGPGQERRG